MEKRRYLAFFVFLALANARFSHAQDQPCEPQRLSDGRPNLNGIWQALNEANYELEAHNARPTMASIEGPHGPLPAPEVQYFGAVGYVPGGLGVVDEYQTRDPSLLSANGRNITYPDGRQLILGSSTPRERE